MRVVLKNWTVFQVSFRASWMDPQCAYMYLVVNDPSVQSLATHTDESSTCLSGVVRGRERLSHRPQLT